MASLRWPNPKFPTQQKCCVHSGLLRPHIDGLMQDCIIFNAFPDNKVHGANVGPTWARQDPGGLHVGHMNFAIWVSNGNTAVLH